MVLLNVIQSITKLDEILVIRMKTAIKKAIYTHLKDSRYLSVHGLKGIK